MGGPLAARVARARPPLSTFDIAAAKMQQHAAESGSVPAASLAELGRNSDVVFLSLPTTNEVRTVVEQLVPTLKKSAIIVDCTSGNPVTSADVARLLPCAYVDLPVSGGPAGAAPAAQAHAGRRTRAAGLLPAPAVALQPSAIPAADGLVGGRAAGKDPRRGGVDVSAGPIC